ncbi:MAG: hypothetical protein U0353_17580 [Sandaracinus sp.]
MRRWASLVVVIAVLCVSCEEDDDASDASVDAGSVDVGEPIDTGPMVSIDTGPAGPDTFDPSCHWDCFFDVRCIDGVVWEQIHAPVPCSAWTGMCPRRELGRCTQGCSDRVPTVTFLREANWPLWCEETEASRPGDPCASDADCQPPEGVEPGGRNYLACDAGSSMCVSIDPPVAPTEGCMASFDLLYSPAVGSAYGVVEDDSCASGLCRFSARGAAGDCDRHACALACVDDWDCPRDYRCEDMPDWTGRAVGDGARGSARVCEGGELVCH